MEKNKNRTDLLAAGRKKLQQYRQKKDGKGGKSSGKAGKSNSDSSANAASSTDKQQEVKIQAPELERSVSDISKGLAEVLMLQSREESEVSDADVADSPPQLPALPEAGLLAEAEVMTTSELPLEDAEHQDDSLASNSDGPTSSINASMERKSSTETPEFLNVDMHMPVDLSDPPDLAYASEVKVDLVHEEDQVPDVGAEQEAASSSSKQAGVEEDKRPVLSQLDENAEALDETRKEDEDDQVASQSLMPSDVSSIVSPETLIQQREDLTVGSSSDDTGGFRSERVQADTSAKTIHMESEAGSVQDMGSITLSQLAEAVKRLSEDEFKYVLTAREPATNVWAILEEHVYLTNLEKDVFHLQLTEEFKLHKEFDHERHQLVNEISVLGASLNEFKGKNESLALERDNLQKQLHFAKAECEELSARADGFQFRVESLVKELAECGDMAAALQTQNGNLDETLTSMAEERRKAEEDKAKIVLENEKLVLELRVCRASLDLIEEEKKGFLIDLADSKDLAKALQVENENLNEEKEKLSAELIGCKRVVESLQMEIANLNESLTSLTEEKGKNVTENEKLVLELRECRASLELLEEEKKDYVSNSNKILTDLADKNEDLNNVLTSLREGREKLDEEKEKLSTELMGSKALVESLRKEIANLNESLALETEGRINLQEEKDYLANENQKLSTEVANFKEAVLRVNQLTEENAFLSNNLNLYKAKDQEFDDRQLLSRSIEVVDPVEISRERVNSGWEEADVELVVLYEIIKQHAREVEAKKGELELNLTECRSRVNEFERQLSLLHEERNSTVSLILKEVGKLDAFIGTLGPTDSADVITCVAASIEAACRNHESMCSLYKELNDKCNSFHEEKELATGMLRQIYGNLSNLVSGPDMQNKKLLDSSLQFADFDSLMNKLNTDIDELKKRCIGTDFILKLVEDINGVVKLEVGELNVDEAESCVESLIHFLLKNYKEANEELGTKETTFVELQGQKDQQHESEILVLKESLKRAMEDLEAVQSNVQEKVTNIDELKKRCIGTDFILKLVEGINGVVELEVNELNMDEAASCVEFLIHFLLQKYKEANNELGMKETSLVELQGQKDQQHENEIVVLEKSLKRAMEDLEAVQSNVQEKVADIDELKKRCIGTDFILKLVEGINRVVKLEASELNVDEAVSCVESLIQFLLQKYKEAKEELGMKESSLGQKDQQHENEILVLKESLKRAMEDLEAVRSNFQEKVAELEQSEQRVSSLREKLGIAVTKGKGLIVQRDGLKQSLAETSNELERCLQELQLKDSMLHEVETKLKSYSEAGERVEALESELSYIRNSATAIRESFLLKDSVLQRIEEILEDLEMPENILARDIIEKVEWLVRSFTGNPEGSMGGGSYSDSGFVVMDAWKEDSSQQTLNSGEDLRRKYEDLHSKFYELAEQNEMLDQSLKERNILVQRWEEVLDKINMPAQFRSMEPEDRIKWLGGTFSEAIHHCDSLTADLEDSQRRILDLEANFQAVNTEKEHLSRSLEILSSDYDKVLDKAQFFDGENDKLQNELTGLQEKLEDSQRKVSDLEAAFQLVTGENNKLKDEITALQQNLQHVEGEIRRLQSLVSDALQDSNTEDLAEGSSATESLEVLLKKLLEKSTNLPSGIIVPRDAIDGLVTEEANAVHGEKRIEDTGESAVMKKELEEALADLISLKEEKDKYMEENQSLLREVERLNSKSQELQELLNQEEQKSASVREKLNLAVRKGKSLVQQRDGMRQTIDEVTSEVERLKSEIKLGENAVSEFGKRMEALESERLFFRNRLAETESDLQEKGHTLSMILRALGEIDVGSESRVGDPIEKIVQIRRRCDDLENDARKSKRAAELLLAELNEVQEQNDSLQEQMYLVEADKREALSRIEKLTVVNFEEREKELVELTAVKSGVDQLNKGFFDMKSLLVDALSKDLEFLHSLETGMMSSLTSSDAPNLIRPSLSGSETKENFLFVKSFSDSKIQEHAKSKSMAEICSSLGQNLQNIMKEIGAFKEILYNHSLSVQKEANTLSEIMASFHQEITSRKKSYESMKGDIIRLESITRERDAKNIVIRKSVSILYEACKSSVIEMVNLKSQLVGNGRLRFNLGSITSVEGDNLFSVEAHSSSEEFVKAMSDSLVSAVNDLVSTQSEILEAREKEMKSTIFNLQKELQEKDIQKDRICVELVGQIKAAEATANSYLQELQPSKTRILDLEKRVNELQDRESTLKDQEEKVRSLTDLLAAKEQEIEALMQALDEEEAQIEDMKNKVEELEGVVQQKNKDLENAEASRLKTTKKLSITVNKFDELHSLSANLLSEVEKLQSQLQERDSEISFLRQEITRCTNDALISSQMNNKRDSDSDDLITWLSSMVTQLQVVPDVKSDDEKSNVVREYKEVLEKKIVSIVSELEDLRANVQSRENLLQAERSKRESLENSLREKESRLTMLEGVQDDPAQSEIVEVEPVMNKWTVPGPTSIARSLRKVNNNDQIAISVDMEPDSNTRLLDDEDDDKAHGFKSLTTSKVVPRFTRPVSNVIDGLWVSCDRALMRQPALRLGVIIYWVVMHALLAAFVV